MCKISGIFIYRLNLLKHIENCRKLCYYGINLKGDRAVKKAYILAGISITFWSTIATVSKLLLGAFSGAQVLCFSSLLAALFLLFKNIFTRNILKVHDYRPKDFVIMTLIGLPGILIYNLLYYIGAARMLASQAFIINYLWPIMSVIFACIILKEKMTVRKGIAIGMSFFGVVIVAGGDIASFTADTLLGAVCILFAAMSYGIFTTLNQKFKYDKNISMMFAYITTFFITAVINIAMGASFKVNLVPLIGFAWNGVFVMGVANTSWAIALESGRTAKISNLAYITPFASLIWTAIFLKEKISVFSVLGLVVIVLGILIQLKDSKKTKATQ